MRAWPRVRAEGKEILGKKNSMEENEIMGPDGMGRWI